MDLRGEERGGCGRAGGQDRASRTVQEVPEAAGQAASLCCPPHPVGKIIIYNFRWIGVGTDR